MWTIEGDPRPIGFLGDMRPAGVLAYYDFERAFLFKDGNAVQRLAYWCDGDENTDRFVVVPCNHQTALNLKSGAVPILSVLDQADVHVVDRNSAGVLRIWKIDGLDQIPKEVLPDADVRFDSDMTSKQR